MTKVCPPPQGLSDLCEHVGKVGRDLTRCAGRGSCGYSRRDRRQWPAGKSFKQVTLGRLTMGFRLQALYNAQDTSPGCWEESEEFHAFIAHLV